MNHTNKRIAKNTLYLYLLTFSNYFLGLLVYPYLARVLSVEKFGLMGFSMSFVLNFQVIVEFGFNISTTAHIAKLRPDYDIISKIVSAAMFSRFCLAVISLIMFLMSVLFVPMVKDHFLIIFLFFINAVISAMLPDFFFRGIEQMGIIAIRTILIKSISLLIIIAFVKNDSQILLVPISMIVGGLSALILSFAYMKKAGVKLMHTKTKETIQCIKDSFYFFLSRFAVSINSSLGSFFLGLKFTPTSFEIGIFAGAAKIVSSGEMMLSPVSESIYPHMLNKKEYRLFKKVIISGTIIGFVACLFIFIFADEICTIILGKEYSIADGYLRILMVGLFFAFPCTMLGYPALSPIGQGKHANIAILASAVLNVAICLVLWMADAINLFSVCIIVASKNIFITAYRGIVFYRYRHLIKV